jgi:hypothetical protein
VLFFSKKGTEASPRLTMGGICLPASRINFMKSIAGSFWMVDGIAKDGARNELYYLD